MSYAARESAASIPRVQAARSFCSIFGQVSNAWQAAGRCQVRTLRRLRGDRNQDSNVLKRKKIACDSAMIYKPLWTAFALGLKFQFLQPPLRHIAISLLPRDLPLLRNSTAQ